MSLGGVRWIRRQTRDADCSPLFIAQVVSACHFNFASPFSIYGVAGEQHYRDVLCELLLTGTETAELQQTDRQLQVANFFIFTEIRNNYTNKF